jgi:DNA-binding CsgD family transcriptional regulator
MTATSSTTTSSRDTEIYYSYLEGKTLAEIGQQHGITRERVRQVLEKQGVNRRSTTESAAIRNSDIRNQNAEEIKSVYRQYGNLADTVRACKGKVPASVVKAVVAEMPETERAKYRNRPTKDRTFDDESMRSALVRAAAAGATTIVAYGEWRDTPDGAGAPSVPLLIMRYGSWRKARTFAGLETSTTSGRSKTFTDTDVLVAVRRFVDACEANGKHPSANNYDSWAKAVGGLPTLSTVRQRTNSTWLRIVAESKDLK